MLSKHRAIGSHCGSKATWRMPILVGATVAAPDRVVGDKGCRSAPVRAPQAPSIPQGPPNRGSYIMYPRCLKHKQHIGFGGAEKLLKQLCSRIFVQRNPRFVEEKHNHLRCVLSDRGQSKSLSTQKIEFSEENSCWQKNLKYVFSAGGKSKPFCMGKDSFCEANSSEIVVLPGGAEQCNTIGFGRWPDQVILYGQEHVS